jgi:hypothetical protein
VTRVRTAFLPGTNSSSHNGAVSNAADDAKAPDSGRRVEVRAEDGGVAVVRASRPDRQTLIPWDQAVAVGRCIIELARARGDLS